MAQLVRIRLQWGIPGFDPWVGRIPWRRESLPTPVFWPGEFHGMYSPWGCKESDTTKQLSLSYIQSILIESPVPIHSVVSDSVTLWTVSPLSMGVFRQGYWSGLPFPPPGDLPDPGIKPMLPVLAGDSLPLSHLGNPHKPTETTQRVEKGRRCEHKPTETTQRVEKGRRCEPREASQTRQGCEE